jgi:hypothetical protein
VKHLLIIFSILILSSPLFGQLDKPQTIIIPTGSLGEMSESRIKILEKTLESKLDDYFSIVPKELFEEAQEQAFQEMDVDECTEDQCILMIKEILQIENAFKMDLIVDEGDTQISITWNNQDQKRVEEDYCEGCKTKGLRLMIGGLVEKLVGNKVNEKPSVVVEKKEPVTENIEDNVEDKKENYTKKLRALTGSATLSSNHIYRSNSYYYIWRRWGFGITDGSLTPEGSRYGRWRFKNRSWDLTYDLDYLIINHIELTIGIGYISEGEASLGNTDIITNEVSGYRLISLFRKSFGNWGLILGYHQNKYEYKLSLGPEHYGYSWAPDSMIDPNVNLLIIGAEIGF